MKHLGTDRHGFSYYEMDHYVHQFRADGSRVGYPCSLGAWVRTFKKAMLG